MNDYVTSVVSYKIDDEWNEVQITTTSVLTDADAKKMLTNNSAFVSRTIAVPEQTKPEWAPAFHRQGEL